MVRGGGEERAVTDGDKTDFPSTMGRDSNTSPSSHHAKKKNISVWPMSKRHPPVQTSEGKLLAHHPPHQPAAILAITGKSIHVRHS